MQRFEQEKTEITERKHFQSHAHALCLLCVLCYLLVICLVSGCGKSSLTPVSGTVTLDGQPLKEGSMHFAAADGQAPTQGAVIADGKFNTELHRTNYKVQIFAPKPSKVVAKLDENGPGGGPRVEELLPPRYNYQSELTLNVTAPTTAANFDLKSK
ncbi:MAG TPA: hypothetical protein VKH44_05985 [Pirellulaceae bacterium]|nr:hypothetical protein [Pirellulaceae bacterium]